MKLIDKEWNEYLGKYTNVWLADNDNEITVNFDPESSEGSTILVISTGNRYMKNTVGKWQKVGTNEVVS